VILPQVGSKKLGILHTFSFSTRLRLLYVEIFLLSLNCQRLHASGIPSCFHCRIATLQFASILSGVGLSELQ
jgi:hypothetical protein